MKEYLEYLYEDTQRFSFNQGLTFLAAAKRMDIGPYSEWRGPAQSLFERRTGPTVSFAMNQKMRLGICPKCFDSIYEVANARGLEIEFVTAIF